MSTETTTSGVSRRTALRLTGVGVVGTAAAGAGVALAPSASAEPRIVPRSEWGFEGWNGGVPTVSPSEREDFAVHYQGPSGLWHWGEPTEGMHVPQREDLNARLDGYAGIKYNFVITQKGEIFEGRGFDLRAGAVKDGNTPAISVQLHFRKGDHPSQAALHSLRWLYAATNRELGNPTDPHASAITTALKIGGHKDLWPHTECPGTDLTNWVREEGPALRRRAQRALDDLNRPPKPAPKEYPGADAFQVGQSDPAVKTLDQRLIKKGYDKHHDGDGYQAGSTFTEFTRRNVRDFQKAQGWSGSGADGYPGPKTWKRLVG